jgi:hypothetical protein
MKTSTTLIISMVIVGSASAALRGTPANDAAAAAPNTLQDYQQRAQMAVPPVVVAATESSEQQRGRSLQLPDQACYSGGNVVPCSQIGSCDNAPVCAGSDQDAVNLGELFCPGNYMVWNNEELTCAWQYMCCN